MDERAAEGVEHLQTAALEMIQAARAFLDVAEDLVSDPEKVADALSALGSVADIAMRATRSEPAGDRPGGAENVQHIRVS